MLSVGNRTMNNIDGRNDSRDVSLPPSVDEHFQNRRIDFPVPEILNTASDVESTSLSEDTFSFLIVAPLFSIPFLTGVLVLGIKTTMYTLILADMMTKGTPNNILGIPASLELPVVVSQVLAVASELKNFPWTCGLPFNTLNL
jgi:hypothetical protein